MRRRRLRNRLQAWFVWALEVAFPCPPCQPVPALSVWWLGLASALLAQSTAECPDLAAVEARLRQTLGLREDAPLEQRFSVERQGEQLHVTARGKDDRLLGERLLPVQGSCDELAGAVAVVLAAWISDEHPEYLAGLPAPEAREAPVPAPAPASPPPTTEPVRPTQSAPALTRDEARSSAGRTGFVAARRFSVAAALGADFSSDVVPLGALGARWMPERLGLGAAVTAVVSGARRFDLSHGSVRYFRWPLLLGPAFRVPLGATALDVHAGAALAWLHIAGLEFSPPKQHDAVAAGAIASARLSIDAGALRPFAELSGVIWGSTTAFIGGTEVNKKLPQVEVYAAFGAAWQPP